MRIWIDILTPKQMLFFEPLIKLFEKNHHYVYRTTRNYREVIELSKSKKLNMTFIGEHGGSSLYNKLYNSSQRVAQIARLIIDKKIDTTISFSSVEAARVAYGLSIPHFCISDSPHAEAASRLTIPLSKLLFTPWVVPKKAWSRYGIQKQNIIQYKAIDPYVWLQSFKPDSSFRESTGLSKKRPIITIRPPEEYAAYLLNVRNKSVIIDVVEKLLKSDIDPQIVIVPRYLKQLNLFKKRFKHKAKVVEHGIDGANLLAYSDIFIGAGGTMTAESVLLGTPTISCYPSQLTYIDQFLIKKGLITHTLKPQTIIKKAEDYLKHKNYVDQFKEKVALLLNQMDDPLPTILKHIDKFQ